MKPVFQKGKFDCGIACIAMLCDLSYDDAKEVCGDAHVPSDGIKIKPMLEILEMGRRVRVVRSGRVTQASPVTRLRRTALLWCQQLPSRGKIVRFENVHNHWAVWDFDVQAIRDPYRHRKPLWVTKFFEIEVRP